MFGSVGCINTRLYRVYRLLVALTSGYILARGTLTAGNIDFLQTHVAESLKVRQRRPIAFISLYHPSLDDTFTNSVSLYSALSCAPTHDLQLPESKQGASEIPVQGAERKSN